MVIRLFGIYFKLYTFYTILHNYSLFLWILLWLFSLLIHLQGFLWITRDFFPSNVWLKCHRPAQRMGMSSSPEGSNCKRAGYQFRTAIAPQLSLPGVIEILANYRGCRLSLSLSPFNPIALLALYLLSLSLWKFTTRHQPTKRNTTSHFVVGAVFVDVIAVVVKFTIGDLCVCRESTERNEW